MSPLPNSPCSATPVRYGAVTSLALAQAADRVAQQAATSQGPVVLGAPPEPGACATPPCGWFESSWDLQQGLMVNELPDRDGAAAALWFSALDNSTAVRDSAWASARHPGCAASAQLQ